MDLEDPLVMKAYPLQFSHNEDGEERTQGWREREREGGSTFKISQDEAVSKKPKLQIECVCVCVISVVVRTNFVMMTMARTFGPVLITLLRRTQGQGNALYQ